MTKKPPDRVTISFPSDAEVTKERLEELAETSEAQSISEYIRRLLSEEDDGENGDS